MGVRRLTPPPSIDSHLSRLLFWVLRVFWRLLLADYYTTHASEFIASTRDADMSDAQSKFIAALPSTGDIRILDAGSGSGRDSLAFRRAGFSVEAFDASPEMVQATQTYANVPTRIMKFEHFAWDHSFEGIWACASLLHVAEAHLAAVLDKLSGHLVTNGVLYLSFKLGNGVRYTGGRRFTDMTEESLGKVLDRITGLIQFEIWQSQDRRPERAAERWVNALVKKT